MCVFHDPARSTQVRKARRAGGISRSRALAPLRVDASDYPLKNSKDVVDLLRDCANLLIKGKLDRGTANAIGFLCKVFLEALRQEPLKEQGAGAEAATKPMVDFTRASLRGIDVAAEAILGLRMIAHDETQPGSARVAALMGLARIFHLDATDIRRIQNFEGWTFEELKDYAKDGTIPERFRPLVGECLDVSPSLRGPNSEAKNKAPSVE